MKDIESGGQRIIYYDREPGYRGRAIVDTIIKEEKLVQACHEIAVL